MLRSIRLCHFGSATVSSARASRACKSAMALRVPAGCIDPFTSSFRKGMSRQSACPRQSDRRRVAGRRLSHAPRVRAVQHRLQVERAQRRRSSELDAIRRYGTSIALVAERIELARLWLLAADAERDDPISRLHGPQSGKGCLSRHGRPHQSSDRRLGSSSRATKLSARSRGTLPRTSLGSWPSSARGQGLR